MLVACWHALGWVLTKGKLSHEPDAKLDHKPSAVGTDWDITLKGAAI